MSAVDDILDLAGRIEDLARAAGLDDLVALADAMVTAAVRLREEDRPPADPPPAHQSTT